MAILADGTECDLLAPGTRVRNVEHPHLTGTVRAIEICKPGVPSAIPYNVDWDDERAATNELGIMRMYQLAESIERLND